MYRYNCVTLKVDKMLPIKVGENNIVARSLFVLLSIHLILFVSNKKLLIESHGIFDDKNVNTLQENKTSTSTSTSSGFVRLSRGNYSGSIEEKSNKEEFPNQQYTYSNHRMVVNDDNLSNNRSSKGDKHSLDETVLDSILRPQLAVQIYTNSPDNIHHQDDSDSTGSQSKSNNMANKLINTKLIVPISQQPQSHHYHHHNHQNDYENSKNIPQLAGLMTTTNHKISNPWHYYTDPTPSSSNNNNNNNANDNNGSDSTDDSYNHQQYDTNTPTINAIITVPHSSQSINSQSDRHNNNNNSNRHQRIYQHDSIRQQQNSDNNGNSTSSIISHLIDDQANGNIEISMNLNGDEIIIDPVSKFGRVVSINTSKENDEDNIKQTNEDNSNRNNPELTVSNGQQKYSSTNKQDKGRIKLQSRSIDKSASVTTSGISNKALRKHISSDLAGGDQQSASEIDQVNNDHNHNSNGYYSDNNGDDNPEKDNDNNSDNDLDFVKTSTHIVDINDRDDQEFAANSKPKLKDIEDEIERDGESSGSRNNRFLFDNNSSSDKDVNVAGDIQTTDESSRDDRLSLNNAYYQQNNRATNQHSIDMRADNDYNSNNNLNNRKQQQRRFSKPSSRQQSVLTSNSGAVNSRKTASSKRRSSYKSDDRDNSNSGIDDRSNAERENRRIIDKDLTQDSNDKVSPVIIKGEDVRKFEQILDNLRALSLNNLALSKSKSIANKLNNKGTPSLSQENRLRQSNYAESGIQNNNNNDRNEDRDDQLASQDAQAKSWNNADHNDDRQQSTNNQAKRNEASSIDSECDRRNRQRQLLQRSASGDEPAFEPDSSPNIVDQDPITSSDGSDDLNDEGSQNIEREEHSGANFHNRQQQQQPTGVESKNQNSNQGQASSDIDHFDEPKTLFVRKTILQNYYDNTRQGEDNKNAIIPNNSDDLDTMHESNHDARHGEILAHEDKQSNRQVVRRSPSTVTTNREPTRVMDNHSHLQQAEKVSTSSKTNEDSRSSPGENNYIDYSQLDDRMVNREAELVSRDKFPSRDQIDRMRSLQHLIERAAIEGSQSDKSILNLNS